MKRFYPWIPAVVAALNGIAVGYTVYLNQPGNYPPRLFAVQAAIVIACLLLVSNNRSVRAAGILLTFVGALATFSAMFLYIPTLLTAVWGAARRGNGAAR
jgi:hypothetical protein